MLEILLEYARLGLISFGGTNVPEFERVLVGERGWLTAETLASGFALGQLMPGPNMLAVTYYGFMTAGWSGAWAATAGFYIPAALLSAAALRFYQRGAALPAVQRFRNALLPFGAGVMLAGTFILGQVSLSSPAHLLLAIAAFGLLHLRLNSAVVVLLAAVSGALLKLAT
ncbi:chromate transporter [Deinococcus lacus]|uniref:Chromate transporter n=1 Tax=Deinococcus lacus TaxID=392561 RepID=A0ABW1YBN4_9DEIO